jgi:hypothetical protein
MPPWLSRRSRKERTSWLFSSASDLHTQAMVSKEEEA